MSQRDSKTGRFVSSHSLMRDYTDPFRTGRTVNEETYRSSLATLESLNAALAQAQSDVERMKAHERHTVR